MQPPEPHLPPAVGYARVPPDIGDEKEASRLLSAHGQRSGQGTRRCGRRRVCGVRCGGRVAEGVLLIVLVNIIWVGASELVQVSPCAAPPLSRAPHVTRHCGCLTVPKSVSLSLSACVFACVYVYAPALLWSQYIYSDLGFNRPFFLTYVSNSLFMVLFPGQYGVEQARARGLCPPACDGRRGGAATRDGREATLKQVCE